MPASGADFFDNERAWEKDDPYPFYALTMGSQSPGEDFMAKFIAPTTWRTRNGNSRPDNLHGGGLGSEIATAAKRAFVDRPREQY
ncbi:hypothetical protein IB238_23915 [Rhizobium sp. ARZ01]|nr:hypothetical protein [Rhizobium sp. ARZ01]